jgi:hypothetical protein
MSLRGRARFCQELARREEVTLGCSTPPPTRTPSLESRSFLGGRKKFQNNLLMLDTTIAWLACLPTALVTAMQGGFLPGWSRSLACCAYVASSALIALRITLITVSSETTPSGSVFHFVPMMIGLSVGVAISTLNK